jgi:hypothetical protein
MPSEALSYARDGGLEVEALSYARDGEIKKPTQTYHVLIFIHTEAMDAQHIMMMLNM